MDTLERLLGSPLRTKVLKLFFMNPDAQWSSADASRQIRVRPAQFLAETGRLKRLNIIKSFLVRMVIDTKRRQRHVPKVARTRVFFVNKEFSLYPELRNLILKSAPHAKGQLANKIRRLGNIKLAILAGVFIDNPTSRIDLLIVGDGLSKSRLRTFIQWLEAEMGKEMKYVVMSSFEFKYRVDMYDRFVRDVLEFPHETVINRLGV